MSELPKGWVETAIKEVGKVVTGNTPSKNNPEFWGKILDFITPTDFKGHGKFITKVGRKLSDEGKNSFNRLVIPSTSVVITCIGSDMGKVAVNKNNCVTNQQINSIIIYQDSHDIDFIYYLLKNSHKVLRLYADGGSTMPIINKSTFESLSFEIPALDEQKSIADILSSFDSKIELLRAQNKTLETLAQTLFKEWFVDFNYPDATGEMINSELGQIPKGWRTGKLEDIVLNIKKSLKKGDDLKGRKYIPIDEIPMRKLGLDSYKPIEDAQSSLIGFESGDILFGAMRCYFHRVCFSTIKGVTRATVMVLRVKKELFFEFSLLLINQDRSVDYANQNSKGTTMPYAVWEGSFANMPVIIPSKDIAIKFSNLTSSLLVKIQKNISQIKILSKTRDALLPKLMSGNIRVNA